MSEDPPRDFLGSPLAEGDVGIYCVKGGFQRARIKRIYTGDGLRLVVRDKRGKLCWFVTDRVDRFLLLTGAPAEAVRAFLAEGA